MRKPPEDYEVGYGKPPVKNRFPPGKSGNPSGRPKVAETLEGMATDELLSNETVTIHGRRRRMSFLRIVLKKHKHLAANGNLKSLELLLRFYDPSLLEPEPTFDPEELALLTESELVERYMQAVRRP